MGKEGGKAQAEGKIAHPQKVFLFVDREWCLGTNYFEVKGSTMLVKLRGCTMLTTLMLDFKSMLWDNFVRDIVIWKGMVGPPTGLRAHSIGHVRGKIVHPGDCG